MKSMKIFCVFAITIVLCDVLCATDSSSLDSNKNIETSSDQEKSETPTATKSDIKTGFHSGFNLGLKKRSLSGVLKPSDGSNNSEEKVDVNNSNCAVNLSIGYDKNFGIFVLGADASVNFNPGSGIEYPNKNNINIVKFNPGTEYLGFAKIGFALGRLQLYSRLGSGLSRPKYDWKVDGLKKDKSDCLVSFAWGGGLEFRISDHVLINFDFIKSNKSSVNNLNVKSGKSEVKSTTVASYQISMGCGYRF